MNWYNQYLYNFTIASKEFKFCSKKNKMTKLAYSSKAHEVEFNDVDKKDGYICKVQLTDCKNGIILTASFISGIYAFNLFKEVWNYPSNEKKRAIKTYNRCINVIEDLKGDYEDEDMPGPTLQGLAREALRYIDIDRKKPTNNRSLEAAKYLDGEGDYANNIYGNRMPVTTININNNGVVNIDNK